MTKNTPKSPFKKLVDLGKLFAIFIRISLGFDRSQISEHEQLTHRKIFCKENSLDCSNKSSIADRGLKVSLGVCIDFPFHLWNSGHANTKWRCTKGDDNRFTSTVTPLLAEPLCYTVSYRYVLDHLYLGRLPAGRGVRSRRKQETVENKINYFVLSRKPSYYIFL